MKTVRRTRAPMWAEPQARQRFGDAGSPAEAPPFLVLDGVAMALVLDGAETASRAPRVARASSASLVLGPRAQLIKGAGETRATPKYLRSGRPVSLGGYEQPP